MTRKILLIGWDSADWRVIDPLLSAGRMPALAALLARGVRGNLAAVEPVLSPLIWTSIATGKFPWRHGVLGFVEPDPLNGGIRNVGSRTRRGPALWNMLSQAGLRVQVAGWFAGHPAESINGICVSERFPLATGTPDAWPVPEGSVFPAEKAAEFAGLRVHPDEIEAAQIQPFIPRAHELDQSDPEVRRLLREVAAILSRTATLQAVTTHLMQAESWDFTAVYFRALDEFAHHFMPYHPPQLPGVSARDAELYGDVMARAYEFHDLMLARLVHLAGPDATVIVLSDHGFESGALRPGARADETATMAQWHRPFGMLAMAGPGIVSGGRVHGASVLDIAPTVLHLLGQPVGSDMDGKVLVTALQNPGPIRRIASWGSEDPAPAPAVSVNVEEERLLLEQLTGLGYLDAMSGDEAALVARVEAELRFNRITSLAQASRLADAVPAALALAAEHPGVLRFQLKAAQVQMMAGHLEGAGQSLRAAVSLAGDTPAVRRMLANLRCLQKNPAAALEELDALSAAASHPSFLEQRGRVLLQLRRWAEAEAAFCAALAIEPENPGALTGLAGALVRQGRDEAALDAVLSALELQHHHPAAHFQLGAILSKGGDFLRAIQSFSTGLAMQPGNLMAHRYLARLYRRTAQPDLAAVHQQVAAQLHRQARGL